MMIGVWWLILFSTVPFYIPLNKLSSYTLEGNRLILKRKEMSECIISINASDGKKIVEAMAHLAIKKN